MNLRNLLEKFIPSQHVERMEKTEPGRLASALDEVLYSTYEHNEPIKDSPAKIECYRVPRKVLVRDAKGVKSSHADTATLLREIRDYLEACALREVLR